MSKVDRIGSCRRGPRPNTLGIRDWRHGKREEPTDGKWKRAKEALTFFSFATETMDSPRRPSSARVDPQSPSLRPRAAALPPLSDAPRLPPIAVRPVTPLRVLPSIQLRTEYQPASDQQQMTERFGELAINTLTPDAQFIVSRVVACALIYYLFSR